MKPPFTLEQFLEVFKNYNEAVFPMQLIFYLLSAIVIYLTLRHNPVASIIISAILAFLWLWMGGVYHIVFFTAINKFAYLFGLLFIMQGFLFLMGLFQNKFSFKFSFDIYGITGVILIIFALISYPVLGYFVGHVYPYSPTFGLPCPTTIFTLGILLFNIKKCPVTMLIIPLIWSVIGVMAAFQFGIVEDIGMIFAGLVTVILLLYRNRTLNAQKQFL